MAGIYKNINMNLDDVTGMLTLGWSTRMGYPRLTIYVKGVDAKEPLEKRMSIIPTELIVLNTVISAFLNGTMINYTSKNHLYVDGKRTDDIVVTGNIYIKEIDGAICWVVTNKDKEHVFPIVYQTKYHILEASGDTNPQLLYGREYLTTLLKRLESSVSKN